MAAPRAPTHISANMSPARRITQTRRSPERGFLRAATRRLADHDLDDEQHDREAQRVEVDVGVDRLHALGELALHLRADLRGHLLDARGAALRAYERAVRRLRDFRELLLALDAQRRH